jgi:hypothetical protein
LATHTNEMKIGLLSFSDIANCPPEMYTSFAKSFFNVFHVNEILMLSSNTAHNEFCINATTPLQMQDQLVYLLNQSSSTLRELIKEIPKLTKPIGIMDLSAAMMVEATLRDIPCMILLIQVPHSISDMVPPKQMIKKWMTPFIQYLDVQSNAVDLLAQKISGNLVTKDVHNIYM